MMRENGRKLETTEENPWVQEGLDSWLEGPTGFWMLDDQSLLECSSENRMNLRVAGFEINLRGALVKEVKYISRFKN